MYLALTRDRFLMTEFITVCRLKGEGIDEKQIMKRLIDENLFQFESIESIKTIAHTLIRRTRILDDRIEMINLVNQGSYTDSKAVNLYCMMKNNQVVEDILLELVYSKYQLNEEMTHEDIIAFLRELADQEIRVSKWSASTFTRTKNELVKILVDSGIVLNHDLGHVDKIQVSSEFIGLLREYESDKYLRIFEE